MLLERMVTMQIWQFIITSNIVLPEKLDELKQFLQERDMNIILVMENETKDINDKLLAKIDLMEKKACTDAISSKKSTIIIYYRSPELHKNLETDKTYLYYDALYTTSIYKDFNLLLRSICILLNINAN